MRQESRTAAAAMAVAIVFSSTASAAGTSAPPTAPQAQTSWQALSILSPAAAIGFAGAATQAVPDADTPPPPEGNAYTGVPIPVIGIWLATLVAAVYILTKKHHGRGQFPQPPPNSPP